MKQNKISLTLGQIEKILDRIKEMQAKAKRAEESATNTFDMMMGWYLGQVFKKILGEEK